MSSLFTGTPVTAATSSQSTTQVPQWMRDAIYNQVQTVQNVASLPFQQYNGQLIAGPTGNQQTAWNGAAQNGGDWQQTTQNALGGLQGLTQQPGAGGVAQPYINNALAGGGLSAAQNYIAQSANANPLNGAQGYINQSANANPLNAAQGYIDQAAAAGSNPLAQAQPWLDQAGQSAAGGINDFMNPYNQQVTDRIAQLGARNLSENLLPGVSDAFVQAGQFGGSRMGEFGSRALRDTQEAVLGEQAKALQSGYGTALGASQAERERQLQIGQLSGQLGGQQQSNLTNLAQLTGQLGGQNQSNLTNLAQLQGQLGGQNQSNLTNLAQLQGTLGGQQQQAQLEAGQMAGNFASSDQQRMQQLYQQILSGGQQLQQQGIAQRGELAGYGGAQRDITQQGNQAAYDQYLRSQQYPQQQTNYLTQQLSSLYPMVPSVNMQNAVSPVGMAPSTASQVAGGLSGLAGILNN